VTAPNLSTRWGRTILGELATVLSRVVVAPGSRSTPLTVAAAQEDRLRVDTHLDERSAGFYALGIGKRSGKPAALISTSGTGAANFHPAVIEAHQSRTPLVVLTADRPPELQDSGANQTIDQRDLYGDAPRLARTLPAPDPDPRTLRSLRTAVGRAVAAAGPPNPGPVHLNVPLRKPLAPIEDRDEQAAMAASGTETTRDGAFVDTYAGTVSPSSEAVAALRSAIEGAERSLIVAGPMAPDPDHCSAIRALGATTGSPILADPLSNVRFGDPQGATVLGGYDGYLGTDGTAEWPDPDLVLRFGASPTSKVLRQYLRDSGATQFLVDPAAGWREATFTATDRVQADIRPLVDALSGVAANTADTWIERFERAEAVHWAVVEDVDGTWEGDVLRQVAHRAPDPATVFVSNSMPVRDLDRFGRPRDGSLTVLGNRGASGIDGVTSTALGAGSATDEPLIAVTGDLAYFHDMNGLVALGRFGLDATIVLLNNDGGGIFHGLPIADFDPPFEAQFETPHGLDFAPTDELYELSFERVEPEAVGEAIEESAGNPGAQVLEVRTDGARNHAVRDRIRDTVSDRLGAEGGNLF
jgi:2-succinyl-5-enolpyruvyl-6-hydroxy-3-cyclohexene-1-carboxylate synthase